MALFDRRWLRVHNRVCQPTNNGSNERRCAPTPRDKQLRAVSLDEVDRSKNDPQVEEAAQTPVAGGRFPSAPFSPQRSTSCPHGIKSSGWKNHRNPIHRPPSHCCRCGMSHWGVYCWLPLPYPDGNARQLRDRAHLETTTLSAVIICAPAAIVTGGFSLAATVRCRPRVGLMNQDLELPICELMIRIALRKEYRQQDGKQE